MYKNQARILPYICEKIRQSDDGQNSQSMFITDIDYMVKNKHFLFHNPSPKNSSLLRYGVAENPFMWLRKEAFDSKLDPCFSKHYNLIFFNFNVHSHFQLNYFLVKTWTGIINTYRAPLLYKREDFNYNLF